MATKKAYEHFTEGKVERMNYSARDDAVKVGKPYSHESSAIHMLKTPTRANFPGLPYDFYGDEEENFDDEDLNFG